MAAVYHYLNLLTEGTYYLNFITSLTEHYDLLDLC
jgi:hypothetical protein